MYGHNSTIPLSFAICIFLTHYMDTAKHTPLLATNKESIIPMNDGCSWPCNVISRGSLLETMFASVIGWIYRY